MEITELTLRVPADVESVDLQLQLNSHLQPNWWHETTICKYWPKSRRTTYHLEDDECNYYVPILDIIACLAPSRKC